MARDGGSAAPLAPGDFRVLTPERVGLRYTVAGIGTRTAAALIDTVIQSAIALLLLVVALVAAALADLLGRAGVALQRAAGPTAGGGDGIPAAFWVIVGVLTVLGFLVVWGYYIVFEIAWNGQTPGKRLVGVRVIRENGYPLRAGDAVVRNLLRIVDALPSGYAIGLTAMLLSDRAKRLGDFAAGTIVVREDRRGALDALSVGDVVERDTAGAVARGEMDGFALPVLAPEHAALVRDFLMRRHTMAPPARRQLAARLSGVLAKRYGLDSILGGGNDEAFLERFAAG